MSRESPFKAGAARISSAVSSRRFAGGAAELADKNESGQSDREQGEWKKAAE